MLLLGFVKSIVTVMAQRSYVKLNPGDTMRLMKVIENIFKQKIILDTSSDLVIAILYLIWDNRQRTSDIKLTNIS